MHMMAHADLLALGFHRAPTNASHPASSPGDGRPPRVARGCLWGGCGLQKLRRRCSSLGAIFTGLRATHARRPRTADDLRECMGQTNGRQQTHPRSQICPPTAIQMPRGAAEFVE